MYKYKGYFCVDVFNWPTLDPGTRAARRREWQEGFRRARRRLAWVRIVNRCFGAALLLLVVVTSMSGFLLFPSDKRNSTLAWVVGLSVLVGVWWVFSTHHGINSFGKRWEAEEGDLKKLSDAYESYLHSADEQDKEYGLD